MVAAAGLKNFGGEVVALIDAPDKQVQIKSMSVAANLMLDDAAPVIVKYLKSNDAQIQNAALRALVALQVTDSLAGLLADESAAEALKNEAVDLLLQSAGGAVMLLPLVEKKRLSPELAQRTIDGAVQHADVNVRLLYEKFIPESERPKTLGQSFSSDDILKLTADAAAGQERVFAERRGIMQSLPPRPRPGG